MEYNYYEKISRKVMMIGYRAEFNLNVLLARPDLKKERRNMYNEFMYKNQSKYANKNKFITIKLDPDFFHTIDIRDEKDLPKKSYMMRYDQEYKFVSLLKKGIDMLNDKTIFVNKNDHLIVKKKNAKSYIELSSGYFEVSPIVIKRDNNETEEGGIKLYIKNQSNESNVYMVVDKLMTLYNYLSSSNSFDRSQQLLNYFGRPDLGTNLVDLSSINYHNDKNEVEYEEDDKSCVIKNGTTENKNGFVNPYLKKTELDDL